MDMLKEPNGIPLVYNTFPDLFRAQYKGKGHEVGDLGRFLTMYRRWQKKFMGVTSYEDFLLKLERVGATYQMKRELKELRYEAWKAIEEESRPGGWRMADEEDGAPKDRQEGEGLAKGPVEDEVDEFGWDEEESFDGEGEEKGAVPPDDVLQDMDHYMCGSIQEDPPPSHHNAKEPPTTTGTDAEGNGDGQDNGKGTVVGGSEVLRLPGMDEEDFRDADGILDPDQEISSAPEASDEDGSIEMEDGGHGGVGDATMDALEDDVEDFGARVDPGPPTKRSRVLLDDDEDD